MTKKTSIRQDEIIKLIMIEQFKQESLENQQVIIDFFLKCSIPVLASIEILKIWNKNQKKVVQSD